MPTVRVQLSTPSAYLRGWRDDYTSTNHAAYFSEYTFTLFSDSKERLRLQSDATTDAAAKPFLENQGVQLFMTHELPLQRLTTTVFNADIDLGQAKLSYGVRYQSTSDSFYWSPTSFYLDQFETATEATNHFLGPQVALNWSKQHFGSNFEIGSKLMVGQSLLDANQRGSYGTSFVPAGLDHSVIDQTHRFSNSIEHDINTTVGEVRASVTYPLLEDLSLRAGYIGIYFADMRWAQDMQRWRLPDMGIDSTQSSDFWSDQFYASIEWRR